ncbi:MAG TPA: RluA family pseudouridine synthase [Verrucomicrobiae bacterium]|nr:RluA family pseudouridine synthase [Verrucomicrobiae bacterium]
MSHVVGADEAGKRADVTVARLSGSSRSLVADAIKRGGVTVNDEVAKASRLLEAGDRIEYTIVPRSRLTAQAEPIDIPIVYEDDDLIVVDKPAGMVSHPAHGSTSGTLVNALLAHTGALPGEELRAGLVHRLDRDTSGLLVVAKNDATLSALGIAMKARAIKREYLGLVLGIPDHARGTLDGPIGRDPHNRLKYAVVGNGKPAITHYEIRETFPKNAELIFRLETGRTHQIRVHLASLGHPILNDSIYGLGEARFDMPGQALHAWRLSFEHPTTHDDMVFEVDPPPEYAAARELLRKQA